MPKLTQTSFTAGEISPSLHARVDLARFLSALKTCRNFFIRPQGGASNRQGTQFIFPLDAASLGALIPFIRAEDDAYMIVLQEENVRAFRDGAFINLGTSSVITNVVQANIDTGTEIVAGFTVTTFAAHGLVATDIATIAAVIDTFTTDINSTWTVYDVPSPTAFRFMGGILSEPGSYTSGGTVSKSLTLTTPYQSDELAAVRYTQSADVLTLAHRGYFPAELTRTAPTVFTFATISDIETGPFLDLNDTATTLTASAATGSGITLTASSSVFTASHIGALVILYLEDLSTLAPWETNKAIVIGDQRRSNGKVYEAASAATTGTVAPTHSEGIELDGDGGVQWEYLHSLFGVARITAQAGTTATADVLSYIPVITPDTTTKWAFGAWSEDQGFPGVVTYFGDRLVFARTLERPQDQWASKTADYHNFSKSSPTADDDTITQTLNSRQTNAIVEMVPLEQLVSLTANSSWASPKRGESWSPQTVGFIPQSSRGSADLRSVQAGDNAIFPEKGGRRLRELSFAFDRDKFGGNELTTLARHLFDDGSIVDMDYAEDPDGILWVVLTTGTLVGLTYLPEQEVIAFHRHDTSGFFERVCVIPEDGRDAVYFIVRRTIGVDTVRYLERLANRTNDSLDAFFVDCGLSYDGRNTTATTVTATGASYDGGESVTLTASSAIFAGTSDEGDAIQFGSVHCIITAYVSSTMVTAELQSPLGTDLQGIPTSDWAFARDTFSGLGHLEGETVTGLADGNAIDPEDTTTSGVVTDSQIVLNYPAAVVHIGLAYTQEIETLTLNVAGNAQIRDDAKLVPKVSVVVEETAGLQVSGDGETFEELTERSLEQYTEPNDLVTGVVLGYPVTTWDKNSSITLRQPVPKPANILAVLPTVVVGGNG